MYSDSSVTGCMSGNARASAAAYMTSTQPSVVMIS